VAEEKKPDFDPDKTIVERFSVRRVRSCTSPAS